MEFCEERLSREDIYSGAVFDIHRDRVRLSDGNEAVREVVEHSGGVCVAAVDEERNIYLVRQYRYPMGEETLELPAGKLEKGESPLPAAIRELAEETGLAAETVRNAGTFYPSPGYSGEVLHFYIATGLSEGEIHPDDGELLRCVKMPLESAVLMAMSDEIKDGKSKALLLLADRLV